MDDEALRRVQMGLVTRALSLSDGVVAHAAKLLQIKRTRLHKIRERLGIR